jgi:hypothetical protein
MSSKIWIEKAIGKTATPPAPPAADKRARLAEELLKMKKAKG